MSWTFLLFFVCICVVATGSHTFALNGSSFHFFPSTSNKNQLKASTPILINQSQVQFKPWGIGNHLVIEPTANNSFHEFKISGFTGNETSGFVSQNLNYSGSTVLVYIKNVSKSSMLPNNKDSQISLTFVIAAGNGHTSFLTFVVGPMPASGWHNDHFYQSLSPGSVQTINLKGLTSHDTHYLRKILISVQGESHINNAEFGVKLE